MQQAGSLCATGLGSGTATRTERIGGLLSYAGAADDPYPAAGNSFIIKILGFLSGETMPGQLHTSQMLVESLTEREYEVLQLLGQGLSNKEMAKRLCLTEGTVKTHVHNVLGKLGAQSRTHAVARGRELKLL